MDEQNYSLEQSIAVLDKLFDLSAKETDKTACEAIAKKAKIIYEQLPESEEIALRYARILVNLSAKQENVEELLNTANSVKEIVDRFNHSEDIAFRYAMALGILSTEQTELKELETTAEKLENLQQKFQDSHDITLDYALILVILSTKQTELDELETTAEKLQVVQQQFQDSHDIAEAFARILVNLSTKQTELNEIETTVEELQALQQQFQDSHDIAEAFARILFNLSTKQTELNEIETTVEKFKALQKQFQDSEKIAYIYGTFLASFPNHQTELSERLQTTEKIKELYEQFYKFMLQNFDVLFFNNDNVCDNKEYRLFDFVLKEGLLKNTKYAILQTWAQRYKEDSSELRNLLSIYQLVQKIKYQLGLKDEDKNKVLEFGHYTKGSTLQIMLNQEGNDKKDFSVSGKTRLYNANYMNDPEEGIVIEQILDLDRRDILEPSSWFLMSFTNKTDDLAMWSQYGDDAKGVCLVLREDDFSRFTSFNDVSWRKETVFIESENKENKIEVTPSELSSDLKNSSIESNKKNPTVTLKDEENKSQSEKKDNVSKGSIDYLYRIAYINTGENFELEKSELFDDDEIKKLDESIKHLKQKLEENFDESDPFYKNAISKCIEEIRYLFKSVDYKYENELRILRYANLDPSNKEIKIDKSSGIGKLYVERENPIQIEEVIFGPKFPNPEYVTPLLKLLDKDINYKKSTIKFR